MLNVVNLSAVLRATDQLVGTIEVCIQFKATTYYMYLQQSRLGIQAKLFLPKSRNAWNCLPQQVKHCHQKLPKKFKIVEIL
jgi:hypothetical protein